MKDTLRNRHEGVRQYTWLKINDSRVSGVRSYLKKTWNNSMMNGFIAPNGFSDNNNHMVLLDINIKKTLKANYYWVLNVKLLQDCLFCEIFKTFWKSWKEGFLQ